MRTYGICCIVIALFALTQSSISSPLTPPTGDKRCSADVEKCSIKCNREYYTCQVRENKVEEEEKKKREEGGKKDDDGAFELSYYTVQAVCKSEEVSCIYGCMGCHEGDGGVDCGW